MIRAALFAFVCLAAVAPATRAQDTTGAQDAARAHEVSEASGAVLRGLDRVSGATEDLVIAKGETMAFRYLEITLGACRYPKDNPSGDAYAWLVIRQHGAEDPLFEGWMIASSPALNALDHDRFDVWVIRCTTS